MEFVTLAHVYVLYADGEGSSSSRDPLLSSGQLSGASDCSHDEDDQEPPALVVYLVDPFTVGSDNTDLQRLACLGLLRCFTTVLSAVPESIRNNISVQVCCMLCMCTL
jgi:mediator of RNA polymerase II transcription subunit 13